jgi:hypothetical protein
MMSNRIKHDVILYGLKPEMVFCDNIIQSIFNEYGFDCERTSITGKKHGLFSLHPFGYAEDYKTKHIPVNTKKQAIADHIRECLPCCDVILEHVGEAQEHIHVEFDPKNDGRFQADKGVARQTGEWPEQL